MQLVHAHHQASVTDEDVARPILAEPVGSLGEGAFVKPRCTSTTARTSASARDR